MRRHLLLRAAFFGLSILLFYAPFALLTRVLLAATGTPLVPDAHRICLRMPFEWLLQPWMYPTMIEQPLFLIALVLLPLCAFFFGPLFCGWLCPAGSLTEFLGRIVPDRFRLDLGKHLRQTTIRYGVLLAMLVSPFLGGYLCCTFCNFTMMQNLVLAATGDVTGMTTWASFTIVTFVLWFFLLGVFVNGGRGWCNLICPAGAAQGLAHALGSKLSMGRAIHVSEERCSRCGRCVTACPASAIRRPSVIDRHACNLCRDCIHLCPEGAIEYRLREKRPKVCQESTAKGEIEE